jgi:hypothetical protein
MSAEERDKILIDIAKTSHRDLDEELKRKHAELKDEFRIEEARPDYRVNSRDRKIM